MKKLLILLFSLFFLSSPSVYADDISDFQIEGMSIGDSLLDYMTEDEILEEIELNINDYLHLNEPYKYVEIYLRKDFPTYSYVSFFIKNNSTNKYLTNKKDKKDEYIILSIRGYKQYIEDFDACIQERDEISEIFSDMFPIELKWEDNFSKSDDPSGKSIRDAVYFLIGEGGANVEVSCSNYEETFRIKNSLSEGLSVIVRTEEINNWLNDY
jgi:hypothetical protein